MGTYEHTHWMPRARMFQPAKLQEELGPFHVAV